MASDACCAAGAPVRHDYEPIGAITEEGGVKYYLVGSGPAGVVLVTDIFGFEYKQVCAAACIYPTKVAANGGSSHSNATHTR